MSARGKNARTTHLLEREAACRLVTGGNLAVTLFVGRHLAPRDCVETACISEMDTGDEMLLLKAEGASR